MLIVLERGRGRDEEAIGAVCLVVACVISVVEADGVKILRGEGEVIGE